MLRKLIIYAKDSHNICQENPSDMSIIPIRYVQETHQIFPGQLSNISGKHIKCLQDFD